MKKLIILFLLLIPFSLSAQDIGGQYYVATDGDDAAAGTYAAPFLTLQKAITMAEPGDSVIIRGGVYYTTEVIWIDPLKTGGDYGNSGTQGNPISYIGYPGESPIFDCRNNCASGVLYNAGISMSHVEYMVFKNFEVRNVYQCTAVLNGAISSDASRHLTFEEITISNVGERGFYIVSGAWLSHYEDGDTELMPYFTDNSYDSTYFINCDVHDLCDSISYNPGNGADAWKTIHYRGSYTLWEGCRAWNYSDDALDPSLANGGEWRINNCWAMPGGDYKSIGGVDNEQNGFKMSSTSYRDPIFSEHFGILTNCLVLWGKYQFVTLEKDKPRGNFLVYNNIAYRGFGGYYGTGQGTAINPRTSIYRNNIEYGSTDISAIGGWYGVILMSDPGLISPESHNTWDAKDGYPDAEITDTVTVTGADFYLGTLDSTEIVTQFLAERQSDGSLPYMTVFRLAEDSDLRGAGIAIPPWDSAGSFTMSASPDIGIDWAYLDAQSDPAVPVESITVSGAGSAITIETDGGTLQMSAAILPDTATLKTVTWSITAGTGTGGIAVGGLVTAWTDGTVTVRATAKDGSGIYDDLELTFSNQDEAVLPTIGATTLPTASNIRNGASGGNVTSDGGATVTERGICWGTSTNPTTSNSKTVVSGTTGSYSASLTGLKSNTTYYVRAYAINSEGTAYGANESFTTPAKSVVFDGSGHIMVDDSGNIIFID